MATTEIEDDALRLETEGEDRLHLLRLTEAEAGLLEEVGETDTRTKEEEDDPLQDQTSAPWRREEEEAADLQETRTEETVEFPRKLLEFRTATYFRPSTPY